jgi:hypothetical protein
VLIGDDVAALEFEDAPPAAALVGNKAPATERATTNAGQAKSLSLPARAARSRATKAASEPEPQEAKSASKSDRAARRQKAAAALTPGVRP